MTNAGKEHGEAKMIGGGDDFRIALRTAGLNDGGRSGFGDFFDTVGKRKESVGRGDGACERELGFHGAKLRGVDAAHLAGANADGLSVARVDDGVGFDVLANFPRKEQGSGFFGRGGAFGHYFQICVLQGANVGVLHQDSAGNIF